MNWPGRNKFFYVTFWSGLAVVLGLTSAFFLVKISYAGWNLVSNLRTPVVYESQDYKDSLAAVEAIARITSSDQHEVPKVPEEGKSIVVNLEEMKLGLYQDGRLLDEIPIISKGKPGSPWETPPGTYRIQTKEEKHFSSIGGVWMPYSMQFFGNFFIHGWPYYPNGKEVSEGYSGGCIRLRTADAEKVFRFADLNTMVLITGGSAQGPAALADGSSYFYRRQAPLPKIAAQAFVVADLDTGEILLSRNADQVYPIASVTKLMTALVSLETVNQFQPTSISLAAVGTFGNAGGLRAGEVLSTKDLLYPLLLESSNDAAEALAEHAGRAHFIKLMNEKANSINLAQTRFEDPSGLSPNNVSTAKDLFNLSQYIFKYKRHVLDLTKTKKITIDKHTWVNQSKFKNEKNYLGGKNGFIDESRHTLVSLFSLPLSEFRERNIAVVLLRSDNKESDARAIVKYLTSNVYYGGPEGAKATFLLRGKEIVAGRPHPTATSTAEVKLLFVGDIMLDRAVKQSVIKNGGGDYDFLFQKTDFLKQADIAFGNLEGPVSDKGKNVGSIYSFRMSPETLPILREAGFDIFSVANNHMGDWSKEAFTDTLKRLKENGLSMAGGGWSKQEAAQPTIIEKNGTKVGYLAFSDVGPKWLAAGDQVAGILLADDPNSDSIISAASKKVDVLVVSYHFGEEYQTEPSARQIEIARGAIDAGAKLVIGHHPHVIQKTERYKGGLIAYSLGNFIFDQSFSKETMQGRALEVFLRGKEISQVKERLVKLSDAYQPTLDE